LRRSLLAKLLHFEKDDRRPSLRRKGANVVSLDEFKKEVRIKSSKKVHELSFSEFREYMICLQLKNPDNMYLKEIRYAYLMAVDYQIFIKVQNPNIKTEDMIEDLTEYVNAVDAERSAVNEEEPAEVVIMKTRYSFKQWIEELFRAKMRDEIGSC
jgi:hypothetical protein